MSLLCRSKVKSFALSVSNDHRNGRFKRVSKDFLDRAEAALKVWMHDAIHRHPSAGVTLK